MFYIPTSYSVFEIQCALGCTAHLNLDWPYFKCWELLQDNWGILKTLRVYLSKNKFELGNIQSSQQELWGTV